MTWTADRLAVLRATDERYMLDRCDILTPDPAGGTNPDGTPNDSAPWIVVTANVICRLVEWKGDNELLLALRLEAVASHRLAVPLSTVIRPENRVTHGGNTFEVIGTSEGGTFQTHLTVDLKQIV